MRGRRVKDEEEATFSVTSQDIDGVLVEATEERSTPPQELERAIEDGVVKAQRNSMGTFIGISPTLLSTDYKGPPAVIERKEDE